MDYVVAVYPLLTKRKEARAQLDELKATLANRDATLEALDDAAGVMMKRMAEVQREVESLRADKARMDWLADKENKIGNVELPLAIVYENPHSLRGAIDAAMAMKN